MEKSILYNTALQFLKIYWKVFKPQTYGIKLVVHRSGGPGGQVLLVRNTYGRTDLWHLPGGGFNPKRETPEYAAERELLEELGIGICSLSRIGEYRTDAQGKRDLVTIFAGETDAIDFKLGPEVSSAEWVDEANVGVSHKIYEVTRVALQLKRAAHPSPKTVTP